MRSALVLGLSAALLLIAAPSPATHPCFEDAGPCDCCHGSECPPQCFGGAGGSGTGGSGGSSGSGVGGSADAGVGVDGAAGTASGGSGGASTGGSSGAATGGSSGSSGGAAGAGAASGGSDDDGGCSCRVPTSGSSTLTGAWLAALFVAAGLGRWRRRL